MASKKRGSGKGRKTPDREISKGLAKLKRAGLFEGRVRNPSRYGREVAKKYADVLKGFAQPVSVPAVRKGRASGRKAATEKAKELEGEFGNIIRRYKNKLIVRKGNPKERASFLPSLDTIVTRYKNNLGETVQQKYVRHANLVDLGRAVEDDEELAEELAEYPDERGSVLAQRADLPPLRPGESYALPFSRGAQGLSYELRATKEEILDLAFQYEQKPNRPYENAHLYIQIRSVVAGPGQKPKRIRKPKVNKTGRNASVPRRSNASNVIPIGRGKRGKPK